MAERRGCHGNIPMIRQLVEMSVQKKVGVSVSCKDGGVLPATGFPRVSGMETSDNSDTVQTYRASHTTHAFGHGRSSSRDYTFEACIFGAVRVRSGVEEVGVHGTSWK